MPDYNTVFQAIRICKIREFIQRARANGIVIIACVILQSCSSHPMPDDVTRPIRTEDIIFHVRCEVRQAVMNFFRHQEIASSDIDVIAKVKLINAKVSDVMKKNIARPGSASLDKALTDQERGMLRFMDVAIAYDLDFNITEQNNAGGALGFRLPFTTPAALDLGASGSLHFTRQGQRQFKAGEKWSGLVLREECDSAPERGVNGFYPIAGSIGLDRVVESFIDISKQGGAKDSFVETLVFTTEIGAGITGTLKLNPVQHSFRLISATATIDASRRDIHKMVVSLVFPFERSARPLLGVDFYDGYLNAPFDRPPLWRARYNICVADARGREDTFKMLRHEAPEIYCIEYADAFAPSPKGSLEHPKTKGVATKRFSAPGPFSPLYYMRRDDKITR